MCCAVRQSRVVRCALGRKLFSTKFYVVFTIILLLLMLVLSPPDSVQHGLQRRSTTNISFREIRSKSSENVALWPCHSTVPLCLLAGPTDEVTHAFNRRQRNISTDWNDERQPNAQYARSPEKQRTWCEYRATPRSHPLSKIRYR